MAKAGRWKTEIGWGTMEDWHTKAGGFTKDGGTLTITEVRRRCIEICGDAPSKGSISPHFNEATRKKIVQRTLKYRSTMEGMFNRRLHRFNETRTQGSDIVEMLPNRYKTVYELIRDRLKCGHTNKGRDGMLATEYIKYWKDHKGLEIISETEWRMPCTICGEELTIAPKGENMQLDHIVPFSRGGLNQPDNMIPVHKICNQSKTDMTMQEYVEHSRKIVKNNT